MTNLNELKKETKKTARSFNLCNKDFEKAIDKVFNDWFEEYQRARKVKWQ